MCGGGGLPLAQLHSAACPGFRKHPCVLTPCIMWSADPHGLCHSLYLCPALFLAEWCVSTQQSGHVTCPTSVVVTCCLSLFVMLSPDSGVMAYSEPPSLACLCTCSLLCSQAAWFPLPSAKQGLSNYLLNSQFKGRLILFQGLHRRADRGRVRISGPWVQARESLLSWT